MCPTCTATILGGSRFLVLVIAYSGDTEWTDVLLEVARGADLFVCEAYFYDKRVRNHLSYTTLRQHLQDSSESAWSSRTSAQRCWAGGARSPRRSPTMDSRWSSEVP